MSENKSDTPRTDLTYKALQIRPSSNYGSSDGGWDGSDILQLCNFARQLERELNQAKAERDDYAKQAEGYKALMIAETQRRDEARVCLKEAMGYLFPHQHVGKCKICEHKTRWRKAAGLAE